MYIKGGKLGQDMMKCVSITASGKKLYAFHPMQSYKKNVCHPIPTFLYGLKGKIIELVALLSPSAKI